MNIDASGMTADYKDIIDHADEVLEMLGAAGDAEEGLVEIAINRNLPIAERSIAIIHLVKFGAEESAKWEESMDALDKKFKEFQRKHAKEHPKPEIYKLLRKGSHEGGVIHKSASDDDADTLIITKHK